MTDETTLAYYIAKYISKAEPVDVRAEVREGIQHAHNIENETAKRRLQRQMRQIMRKREVRSEMSMVTHTVLNELNACNVMQGWCPGS